jgi:hypothetical protein
MMRASSAWVTVASSIMTGPLRQWQGVVEEAWQDLIAPEAEDEPDGHRDDRPRPAGRPIQDPVAACIHGRVQT